MYKEKYNKMEDDGEECEKEQKSRRKKIGKTPKMVLKV